MKESNGDMDRFDTRWEEYLEPIKAKVRERAAVLARDDGREKIGLQDTVDAIREFIPPKGAVLSTSEGWWRRNISGFIVITAILAVIFGALGTLPQTKDAAAGLFEIAKMLAGALVGGAAGAAATGTRRS